MRLTKLKCEQQLYDQEILKHNRDGKYRNLLLQLILMKNVMLPPRLHYGIPKTSISNSYKVTVFVVQCCQNHSMYCFVRLSNVMSICQQVCSRNYFFYSFLAYSCCNNCIVCFITINIWIFVQIYNRNDGKKGKLHFILKL